MGTTLTGTFNNRKGRPAPTRVAESRKSIVVIKLTYWLGIVADALWAVGLLTPNVYGVLVGTPDFTPDFQTRQLMLIAGSLMTGWTFLLIWGLKKPITRRGVLLLTAFPVIFGLFITTVNGISNGNPALYWVLVKLVVLITAMVGSYLLAGKLARRRKAKTTERSSRNEFQNLTHYQRDPGNGFRDCLHSDTHWY